MHIAFVEISNFRKLRAVRVDLSKNTTLFVGSNNSGKTSAMLALRRFLVEKGKRFRIYDFTLSHWSAIDAIGKSWEDVTKATDLSPDKWASCMPALDIWFQVANGELHHVSALLPSLNWTEGQLGVRLRLQPQKIEALYKEYFAAISEVRKLHAAAAAEAAKKGEAAKPVKLWPVSLTDFLSRRMSQHMEVRAYLLDPNKKLDPKKGQARPQELPAGAMPLDEDPLQGLVRVNEINAQRGLGEPDGSDPDRESGRERESNKLSEQLRSYYAKHLDPLETPDLSDLTALQAIETAQEAFDARLRDSFSPAFCQVEGMGYPGVTDPKLRIASKLKTTDGLNHESALSFEIQATKADGIAPQLHLPESYNGLGYQNLISMVFKLMSYRDGWMRVGKAGKSPNEVKFEPLHLVLVEEPEAHLHAQVQQVFITKAYQVLRDHDNLKNSTVLHTQLVVSSHSSHVAHEMNFADLRYFRRLPAGMNGSVPTSTVINLTSVFGDGDETLRFVTRYLRAHHCDLFFADAAILVEGPAEKILVPNFIRTQYRYLTQCYITVLEINGSHAHRLKPLIEALGLLTLIITDLDASKKKAESTLPELGTGQITSNPTLKSWIPGLEAVDELVAANESKKITIADPLFAVRAAYQISVTVNLDGGNKVEQIIPSTFEDSLVLENLEFFSSLEGGALAKNFSKAISTEKSASKLAKALYDALRKGTKAEFALDVLLSDKFDKVSCPMYIAEGLQWLQARLELKRVETLSDAKKHAEDAA